MAILLPSHRNCTTQIHTEAKFFMRPNYSSLHRKLTLVSKLKLCLQKIYRNLDQLLLGTFLFAHSLIARRLTKWPKWPHQGTIGLTRGLQTERSFSMMHVFRQSSEGVGLSQVSFMLRQLTGQISAHNSSFKIRNIHTSFSSRSRTVNCIPVSEQNGSIPFGVACRPKWLK